MTETQKATFNQPWQTFGPFKSFEECSSIKDKIKDQDDPDGEYDFKIKCLTDGFYLKARKKEEIVQLELQDDAERIKKKNEKKALNKSKSNRA